MGSLALHDIGRYDLMGPAADAAQWAGVFLILGFVTFLIGAALWRAKDHQAPLDMALTLAGSGKNKTLTARLSDADTSSDGLGGATVDFFANGTLSVRSSRTRTGWRR